MSEGHENTVESTSVGNLAQVGNLYGDIIYQAAPTLPLDVDTLLSRRGDPVELPSAEPIQTTRRVALLGAPGAGKTCFLTALNIAAAQTGQWAITGNDPESTQVLIENTELLLGRRQFPSATFDPRGFRWRLSRQLDARVDGKPYVVPVSVDLDVLDIPGGALRDPRDHDEVDDGDDFVIMGASMGFSPRPEEQLASELAGMDGLVFFFDAERERIAGDNHDYLHRALAMLEYERGGHGRLPHRVAVCIAKYDQPEIVSVARKHGYVWEDPDDPYGFPRVRDDQSRRLFDTLCALCDNGSASLIRHSLDRYFMPGRVKFFASSSIGFFVDSTMRFRWDQYSNIHRTDKESFWIGIRGDARPINVLEPLLWLQTV